MSYLVNMSSSNGTMVGYFILKGISDLPELQVAIFLLVLLIYLTTLGGNIAIFLLILLNNHLHTPMYFFLANLAILDMSSSTITLHRILFTFISGDKTISVFACMVQMYIFSSITVDELMILTSMSYDRYAAICNPLHYHMIMNIKMCAILATLSWVLGFIQVIPIVVSLSRFRCYMSNVINHFFCDVTALIKLSCDSVNFLELFILVNGAFLATLPLFLTFSPYIFIIVTILRIRTRTDRSKAFFTCSSHIIVVLLLYVTLICQYCRPNSMGSLESNKLFSLFNTVAVPMLNPLIYSLKNKDVKLAFKRKIGEYLGR